MAMHKPTAKAVFRDAGLPVAEGLVARPEDLVDCDPMPAPFVVKPTNQGSSVGVRIVRVNDNSWREEVAATRRRAYRDEPYWARPIPGWGDERPWLLIIGLAPAAHGGNRTGRIFTGDRSGDFLFASLHRCGLAAKPTSVAAGDGQRLIGVRMAAAVRCAPPENKPLPEERDTCAPWLATEFRLVAPTLRVVVCLGGFAWQVLWPVLAECGYQAPRPRPAFGHGVQVRVSRPGTAQLLLLGTLFEEHRGAASRARRGPCQVKAALQKTVTRSRFENRGEAAAPGAAGADSWRRTVRTRGMGALLWLGRHLQP